MANTIQRSLRGGDATLHQITLTTCFILRSTDTNDHIALFFFVQKQFS